MNKHIMDDVIDCIKGDDELKGILHNLFLSRNNEFTCKNIANQLADRLCEKYQIGLEIHT